MKEYMSKKDCEMSDKELKNVISVEDAEKMNQIRRDIIMQYENCVILWDSEK